MDRFGDPELLAPDHALDDFDCGRVALNLWLTKHARQAAAAGSARPYVVVDSQQARVVGYHALAAAGVEREAATSRAIKGMPRYPIPVVTSRVANPADSSYGDRLGVGKCPRKRAARRGDLAESGKM